MCQINYRELTEADAAAVRELRASVLKSDPDTFSISIEEENKGSEDSLKAVLATYHNEHDRAVFGAFGNTLVGMVGIEGLQGDFTRHKARIWGLYVVQDHRKAGIGAALIARSIEFAERLGGVEKILLDVTGAATDAIKLYEGFGFTIIGSETNSLKVGHRYIDDHRMELRLKK